MKSASVSNTLSGTTANQLFIKFKIANHVTTGLPLPSTDATTWFCHTQQAMLHVTEPCGGFYFIYGAGLEQSPVLLWPFVGLLYWSWMVDGDECGAISGMIEWQGRRKCSEKTCLSAALSTTAPI
jgi:hypothetical protein